VVLALAPLIMDTQFDSLFSNVWEKVSLIRPKVLPNTDFFRHYYRGVLWYVIKDPIAGKYLRFSPVAYHLICLINNKRTIGEIWTLGLEQLRDDSPTQDETIKLFRQLIDCELIQFEGVNSQQEVLRKNNVKAQKERKQLLWNPLSFRFKLWNPDAFLDRSIRFIEPLLGRAGFILWFIIISIGLVEAIANWSELTKDISSIAFSPDNLIIMVLIYPCIKLCHELGHAYMSKSWGGAVNEMGVMLIVFMPIPYVEASSSTVFRNKYRRITVAAAGIAVELVLATFALLLWLNMEPSLARSIIYNVMIIGGVSTLLFNGNPLLKFDGYYVFSDAIEIPNLGIRAGQYVGFLIKRFILGDKKAAEPATVKGEKKWLISYGIASTIYKFFLTFFIIFFVANQYFFVGVVLAIWAASTMVVWPLFKKIQLLIASVGKAGGISSSRIFTLVVIFISVFCLFPAPLRTMAEGVVWLEDENQIRPSVSGVVTEINSTEGRHVQKGELLMTLENPEIVSEFKLTSFLLQEYQAKYSEARLIDPAEAKIIRQSIIATQAKLSGISNRVKHLQVRSMTEGIFILPNADDLLGRFFKRGELVAYVINFPIDTVKVIVEQDSIALIRGNIERVDIRFSSHPEDVHTVTVKRIVPAATHNVINRALGESGGGNIVLDMSDDTGMKAYEAVFHIELQLDEALAASHVGERVYVLFSHGNEALIFQWYRQFRNLFLSHFSI